ncbi:TPA: phage portal protein, partial [Escherichia coli]|nr:phage portal protein [Escherichia coli]
MAEMREEFSRRLDEAKKDTEHLRETMAALKREPEPDIAAMVADEVKSVPLQLMLKQAVQDAVIPLQEMILKTVQAEVREVVAEIPVPQDGKSVTVDDVRPVLQEMVNNAMSAVPPPRDGRDYDPEVLKQAVQNEVSKAVAEIPVPQDGKSVTVDDVRPVLQEMVNDAVSAVPPPRDGRDYDPEVLKQAVQAEVREVVAEIPVPQDGKSVTVDDVRPVLQEMVNNAVSALPPPRDGRDYDPEVLKQAVQDEVSKAVAEIPVPQDGRDATALEILPCIDTEKSYPRGTWATQDGGLWRAYENTHGMRGWECVVDGVSGVDIRQDNLRSFTLTLTRSGGVAEAKTFSVPVMLYRGVFSAEKEYQPGDTVTWGGSLWHCDAVTTDRPDDPGAKG